MVPTMAPSLPRLHQPLTVTDFMALDELSCHFELQQGSLLLVPSPTRRDQLAATNLAWQIAAQLPANLMVFPGADVDLPLVGPNQPGTCRRPDLVVLDRTSGLGAGGCVIRAAEVKLAIEITADGSRRMDHIQKRVEYAEAGIPHYWIITLDTPASLLECRHDGRSGYADSGPTIGTFSTAIPFPVVIDLEGLVRRRAEG
jgi:Uma2 family endonuclease